MKSYVLVLLLFLTACSGRLSGSNLGYLSEYQDLDLKYKNDPEKINATQADTAEHLDPYSGTQWADDSKNAPDRSPYKLDTFHGDNLEFNAGNVPLSKVKEIDNDTLFTEILRCYPAESLFDGDLRLQTTASPIKSNDREYDNYYAKVVLEMPLYSSSEVSRRLDRENLRRQTTADFLAGFSEALARKNQAVRLVSLYRSLEKRSSERVAKGLASTDEQVGFLEKTANAHTKLLSATADVMKFRLKLVSLCSDQKAPKLNDFLKRISGEIE